METRWRGSIWALQKTPGIPDNKRYGLTLLTEHELAKDEVRVVFHSRFNDGTPCGTWSQAVLNANPRLAYNPDAVATFSAPARAGWGWIWADYWNQAGQKIGRSSDHLFRVLPLGVRIATSPWQPTQQKDEWTREVHAFAVGYMPEIGQNKKDFLKR